MTERLDRIEAVLAEVAESQQRAEVRLDRIEQLTESNARAIAAHGEELRTSIADMVSMVGAVAENLQRQSDQAEIDRAEFRAQFRQLIEVLTQQYNGNGRRE